MGCRKKLLFLVVELIQSSFLEESDAHSKRQ
jgi:hypothetical protein